MDDDATSFCTCPNCLIPSACKIIKVGNKRVNFTDFKYVEFKNGEVELRLSYTDMVHVFTFDGIDTFDMYSEISDTFRCYCDIYFKVTSDWLNVYRRSNHEILVGNDELRLYVEHITQISDAFIGYHDHLDANRQYKLPQDFNVIVKDWSA